MKAAWSASDARTERPQRLSPARLPVWLRAFRPTRTARGRVPLCPELDCVRHLLPPGVLTAAEGRAAELGVDAACVLIVGGHIAEDDYVRALAASLGMGFDPLERSRHDCPQDDEALLIGAQAGMLRMETDASRLVVAPLTYGSRGLATKMRPGSDLARRIDLTTTARLRRFALRYDTGALESIAAERLRQHTPSLSAAPRTWPIDPRVKPMLNVAAILTLLMALGNPAVGGAMVIGIESALFVAMALWTILRLFAMARGGALRKPSLSMSEADLPTYTVIAALYRESRALPGLVAALANLDYPPEKLDIKLVLEVDDVETRTTAEGMALPPQFEIVLSPRGGPRTKPKALNAALALSKGAFVAIYDAEDRPDADQLRLAVAAFDAGGPNLACVQGRLTIDNTADSLLSRSFTAEYAGLFDVLLPGLARHGLPMPLGGTSNHFRADVLQQVGAWDPYNVTEDADLGLRLARAGYRIGMIASTTYEEAPFQLWPWIKQRTRWFKGWMQTYLVHMREPMQTARELGWTGFFSFQLMIGGSTLAALVHLPAVLWILWQGASGQWSEVEPIHFVLLGLGYATSGALGVLGLARRRLLRHAWIIALIPFYWMLLSVAAWRALFQLRCNPYHWEKTEHGLSKHSRLGKNSAFTQK